MVEKEMEGIVAKDGIRCYLNDTRNREERRLSLG